MSTSNKQLTSHHLQESVNRTLRGAGPRHLAKRFHQLMRLDRLVTILVPQARPDGKHQTMVPMVVKGSRLAAAGLAWEKASQSKLFDQATAFNESRPADVHHVARVL